MKTVVVTDQAFGGTLAEEAVAAAHGALFRAYQCTTEGETVAATAGADVVLVNFAPITARVLAGLAPKATVIRYGIGVDNVDVSAAREHGVSVANVPDYGSDTVADHTVASMLSLIRKVTVYDRNIKHNGWCAPADVGPTRGFVDITVGLLGTGRIGLAVARRLIPFGFSLIAHDPYASPNALRAEGIEPVDHTTLLRSADVLTLHCPLTENTRHTIDGTALALVKKGTLLVNTSRGALIDEQALADALQSGQIGGAALDVFETEPLPDDSPLRRHDHVHFTPHAAFYSERSLAALQTLAAEEAGRALSRHPLRCPVA